MMSLDTVTPAAGAPAPSPSPDADEAPIWKHEAGGDGPLTPRQAMRSLIDARFKRDAEAGTPEPTGAEPAAEVPPTNSVQADAAPPETEVPGETTERAEPEETLPPIEPPRSWTKEAKERWQSLPRDTQEYISGREQEREREFRRSQNEAAEARKGIDAERVKVEQARQQYEAALPALLQTLQEAQAGDFSDIKTMADITRLATEDPLRFTQWQASQMKIAAVHQQMTEAQQRQATEAQKKWADFVEKEDALAAEKIPELADKAKATKLQESAVEVLRDLGFTAQELGKLYRGDDKLSIRDHRFSLLIRDAVKWREAESKAKEVVKKPIPAVQRPGVAASRPNAAEEQIKNLESQLSKASGMRAARIAADLVTLRRQAAAR